MALGIHCTIWTNRHRDEASNLTTIRFTQNKKWVILSTPILLNTGSDGALGMTDYVIQEKHISAFRVCLRKLF